VRLLSLFAITRGKYKLYRRVAARAHNAVVPFTFPSFFLDRRRQFPVSRARPGASLFFTSPEINTFFPLICRRHVSRYGNRRVGARQWNGLRTRCSVYIYFIRRISGVRGKTEPDVIYRLCNTIENVARLKDNRKPNDGRRGRRFFAIRAPWRTPHNIVYNTGSSQNDTVSRRITDTLLVSRGWNGRRRFPGQAIWETLDAAERTGGNTAFPLVRNVNSYFGFEPKNTLGHKINIELVFNGTNVCRLFTDTLRFYWSKSSVKDGSFENGIRSVFRKETRNSFIYR